MPEGIWAALEGPGGSNPTEHAATQRATIHASVIGPLRRQPMISFFVIAFAWTWAFVIVFLILFPLPDIMVRTTPAYSAS